MHEIARGHSRTARGRRCVIKAAGSVEVRHPARDVGRSVRDWHCNLHSREGCIGPFARWKKGKDRLA